MKADFEQNPRYLQWAGERLEVTFDPSPDKSTWITCLADDGEILAVVVYTRFAVQNCEMSIASSSPRWASRRMLRIFFQYPFGQLGYRRVTAVTDITNTKSIAMLGRLDFVAEGCLRKWFGESDALVFGLLKEDCKWL